MLILVSADSPPPELLPLRQLPCFCSRGRGGSRSKLGRKKTSAHAKPNYPGARHRRKRRAGPFKPSCSGDRLSGGELRRFEGLRRLGNPMPKLGSARSKLINESLSWAWKHCAWRTWRCTLYVGLPAGFFDMLSLDCRQRAYRRAWLGVMNMHCVRIRLTEFRRSILLHFAINARSTL